LLHEQADVQVLQAQLGCSAHVGVVRHAMPLCDVWMSSWQLQCGIDRRVAVNQPALGFASHGFSLLFCCCRVQVVGCDGTGEQSIASAVQSAGEAARIILACTQVPEASSGTPQGVAAELQQLQEAHDAVAAFNKRQLTVYAVQPDASAIVQQRRLLQSSNADVGVCGQLCRVSDWPAMSVAVRRCCGSKQMQTSYTRQICSATGRGELSLLLG
jgi:hypothetical protein